MIPTMILLGLVLCVGLVAFQVLLHAPPGERLHVRLHVHGHAHRTAHRPAPRHVRR